MRDPQSYTEENSAAVVFRPAGAAFAPLTTGPVCLTICLSQTTKTAFDRGLAMGAEGYVLREGDGRYRLAQPRW